MAKKINDFSFNKALQRLDVALDLIQELHGHVCRNPDTPYWQVDLCRAVCEVARIADDLHSQLGVCIDRIDELSVLVDVLDNKYADLLYHLSNKDE